MVTATLGHRIASVALAASVGVVGVGAPSRLVPNEVAPTSGRILQDEVADQDISPATFDLADPEGWGLVPSFADGFRGVSLDPARWQAGHAGEGLDARTMPNNKEREIYVDPSYLGLGLQPITVTDGELTITANPLTPQALAKVHADLARYPDLRDGPLRSLAYSSGRITTRDRFSQLYGYFEIRTRFSPGRGLWPAFWLLPADGSWPPEIDVMEIVAHEPEKVHQTTHSKRDKTHNTQTLMTPTPDGFHRYGVLWMPDITRFYVDGILSGVAPTPPDADKPMYMIVNLAVGGNWPGSPDAATKFPATMDVDYVRAWRFPQTPRRAGTATAR